MKFQNLRQTANEAVGSYFVNKYVVGHHDVDADASGFARGLLSAIKVGAGNPAILSREPDKGEFKALLAEPLEVRAAFAKAVEDYAWAKVRAVRKIRARAAFEEILAAGFSRGVAGEILREAGPEAAELAVEWGRKALSQVSTWEVLSCLIAGILASDDESDAPEDAKDFFARDLGDRVFRGVGVDPPKVYGKKGRYIRVLAGARVVIRVEGLAAEPRRREPVW